MNTTVLFGLLSVALLFGYAARIIRFPDRMYVSTLQVLFLGCMLFLVQAWIHGRGPLGWQEFQIATWSGVHFPTFKNLAIGLFVSLVLWELGMSTFLKNALAIESSVGTGSWILCCIAIAIVCLPGTLLWLWILENENMNRRQSRTMTLALLAAISCCFSPMGGMYQLINLRGIEFGPTLWGISFHAPIILISLVVGYAIQKPLTANMQWTPSRKQFGTLRATMFISGLSLIMATQLLRIFFITSVVAYQAIFFVVTVILMILCYISRLQEPMTSENDTLLSSNLWPPLFWVLSGFLAGSFILGITTGLGGISILTEFLQNLNGFSLVVLSLIVLSAMLMPEKCIWLSAGLYLGFLREFTSGDILFPSLEWLHFLNLSFLSVCLGIIGFRVTGDVLGYQKISD